RNSRLDGADFTGAEWRKIGYLAVLDFSGAKGFPAHFYTNWKRLPDKDLSGCDLTGIDVKYMDFAGFNFQEADLSRTVGFQNNFIGADFRKANLLRASFNHSQFDEANFTAANLEKAYFVRARFENAIFDHANLKDADFMATNLYYGKVYKALHLDEARGIPQFLLKRWKDKQEAAEK
ncbi:MAG: pentapeptide repeat-containing protein, partial [Bacteroidota bacterium]